MPSHQLRVVSSRVRAHGSVGDGTRQECRPQRAAEIARRYVTLSHHDVSKVRARVTHGVSATPYYIYNDAQGRGFVVVAGDDAMGEVLAYGTEGALDTLSANPCVRLLLDGYRQTFEVLREAAVPAQKVRRAAQYTKKPCRHF